MKHIILLIAIVASVSCAAQKKKLTDAQLERRIRELSADSRSLYTTEFSLMDLNYVNKKVQAFLSERMDMAVTENSSKFIDSDSTKILSEEYHSKGINKLSRKLKFAFTVKTDGNDFVVQSCNISGDKSAVIDFYVKYWETSFDFDNTKKDELVVNRWINDRISLIWNSKEAVIRIEKN